MAKLTGLMIQKLLPKTNCKECGSNTCLAFAMKLAAQKADLSECPYASDEAKQVLGAASEAPVRGVAFGPEKTLKIGEETCFYRHEKTFVHQTAFAVNINDDAPQAEIDKTIAELAAYTLNRVGEILTLDMVAVTHVKASADAFAALAAKVWTQVKRPLILRSSDMDAMRKAAAAVKGSRSLLASATEANHAAMLEIAKENDHVLAVTAPDLDGVCALSTKIKEAGFNDLVLEFQTHSLAERFQTNAIARKAALKAAYKPLGYATLSFIHDESPLRNTVMAINEICKYGGICVFPRFDKAQLAPLMALRQNVYTDPQKPIQVEPKIYAIGEPTTDSPVFITTNFSLTYFIVSGEIENSGSNAWLLVPECEGMSVLTAWAAGKFSGASIGKFAKDVGLAEKVKTREIIIPGYVSQISGELEENMPGWKVIVGPQEAGDIESFVKARLAK